MRTERIEQLKPYGVVNETGTDGPATTCSTLQPPDTSERPPRIKIPHNIYWSPDDSFPTLNRTVALANVRKIRVSSGAAERIRGPSHVSGLCFEFHDETAPVYLGQWFREVASLDIAAEEKITGFTFWQTQELRPEGPVPHLQGNPGQLAGIQIDKTGEEPRSLEVCLMEKAGLMRYAYADNRWQDLVGNLLFVMKSTTTDDNTGISVLGLEPCVRFSAVRAPSPGGASLR